MSYWKRLQLKKLFGGVSLSITLTYNCNLKCSYCTNKNDGSVFPVEKKNLNFFDWIDFITNFPVRVYEISFTGGSPELYHGFYPLVNKLLKKGYLVNVYSNMMHGDFSEIIPSKNFKVFATYHHCSSITIFTENYNSCRHQKEVSEIDYKHLSYSSVKPYAKIEKEINKKVLRVGPDGLIFTNCFERNRHYLE